MSTHVCYARNPLPRPVTVTTPKGVVIKSYLAAAWLFVAKVALGIVADDSRSEAAADLLNGRVSPMARRAAAKARRIVGDRNAEHRAVKTVATLAQSSLAIDGHGIVASPKAAAAASRRERREAREAAKAESRLAAAAANAAARATARAMGTASIDAVQSNTSTGMAPRTARVPVVLNVSFVCRAEGNCAAPSGYRAAAHIGRATFATSSVTRTSAKEWARAVLNGPVYFLSDAKA